MSSCDITFSDVQAIPRIQDLPAFILRNRLIIDKARRIKSRLVLLRSAIERNNELRAQQYFLSPGSDNYGDGPQATSTSRITNSIQVIDHVLAQAKINGDHAWAVLFTLPPEDEVDNFIL